MRLRKVHLENFRSIRDATLDFAGPDGEPVQVMALVGPNGSGKTAWLDAIAGFFSHPVTRYGGVIPTPGDIRQGAGNSEISAAWQEQAEQYQGALHIVGEATPSGRQRGLHSDIEYGKVMWGGAWGGQVRDDRSLPIGVMSMLDAHRLMPPIVVDGPRVGNVPVHHADGALASSIRGERPGWRFANLAQWIVNLEFARARAKADRGESLPAWDHLVRALDTLLAPCRFERVSEDFEVLFRSPSGVVPMARLSSGFQSVLVIVTELLMRLSLAAEDPAKLFEVEAVCMIDEIDAHLHPAWQDRIMTDLRWIFPKVQFLVTTHSERVVATLAPHEISILEMVDP